MIGTSVSHYRIIEKLGAGGMGEVYSAEDRHLGRVVAIKFPTPQIGGSEFLRRFQHEARTASRLAHPNIARVYDYGEAPDGRPFLVMELVRGTSLRDLLRRGRLEPARASAIAIGILHALEEAHAHGLVHRDIKPANVMVDEGGTVRVLDFGLAKAAAPYAEPADNEDPGEAQTVTGGLTVPGAVPGTPAYMSPEQASGGPIDARSDLFSTGVLLYRCLTGTEPFAGVEKREVIASILTTEPAPASQRVPALDKQWDRVLTKALRKDPAERYQSAREMLTDLERLDPKRAQSAWRRATSMLFGTTSATVTTVAAAAIVAIAVSLTLWRSEHQPPPEAADWYQRGTVALRDGTYYAAARMLQKAVDVDRRFALAHARLAEAASELDDSARANAAMLAAVPAGSAAPGGVAGLYIDAVYRSLTNDLTGAASVYQQLVAQLDGAEKASALVDLGRVHEKNSAPGKALTAYREAIDRDPSNAAAHLRAAIILGRQRDPAFTAELDKALALYQTLSNAEGQAEVYLQRGYLLSNGDAAGARAALERARDIARAIPSEQQEIAATLQLSTLAYVSGDLDTGSRMAAEGVERARTAGMNYLAARGLVSHGDVLQTKRDWKGAEARLRESLELSRRHGMRRTEARALFSMANLHQTIGPVEAALKEASTALAYYRDAGFRTEAIQCLLVLGRSQRDLGRGNDAVASFEDALATARKIPDPANAALAEQGIATLYLVHARWPEALTAYERFRASAAALNNTDNVVRGLTGLGTVLSRLGRYDEANRTLADAERELEKVKARATFDTTLADRRAQIALSLGKHAEAVSLAKRVYETTGTNPQSAASARCLAAVAMARSGQAAAGRPLCEPALDVLVNAGDRSAIAEARLRLAEIRLATGDRTAAIADAAAVAQSAAAAGDPETSWRAWALQARALSRGPLPDPRQAKDAAAKAAAFLASLSLDPANLQTYTARPDIAALQREIQSLSK